MAHFYDSTLIDTVDGLHCKSYSNEHPDDFIIVRPKYVPATALSGEGLKYRFLFEKCLVRFNPFAKKDALAEYVRQFKKKFPDYIYECPVTKNWFFAVPRSKVKLIHDGRKGLQEFLKMPEKDLDSYLKLVRELIDFMAKSGVSTNDLGITHSTLLGNYTIGKSDIDIIIYGKKNGWRILDYLKDASHPKLHWKTDAEWAEYYKEHNTSESSNFTEKEYVKHALRKRHEGVFGGTVFTLFTVEEPHETWFKWGDDSCEPVGTATITGEVTDDFNSHVRPGIYEIEDAKFLEGNHKKIIADNKIPIRRVVTYSMSFVQQAVKGEKIKACGLLELITPKHGDRYYRIVVGYFDAYVSDRRQKEFIKTVD